MASSQYQISGQPFYNQSSLFTWKPIVSGILILIGAIWCFIPGLVIVFIWEGYWYSLNGWGIVLLAIIIFECWCFSIGLVGSILMFKRKKFVHSIWGAVFVLVGGCLAFYPFIVFGVIILPLSIIGIVFLSLSKNEFDIIHDPIPRPKVPIPSPASPLSKSTTPYSINVQQLRDLKGLKDDGIITEKEYEEKRRILLSKL
jgi:hypothetical protein